MDLSMICSSHVFFPQGLAESRKMAAQHLQFSALDFVLVLEQPTRRRTRRMRSILVKRATVAWAHEQPRFLKPTNRAPKMRAVDRENLERFCIDPADPARNFGSLPVPRFVIGVTIDRQSSLAFRELVQRPERNPTVLRPAYETRQGVSQKRHAYEPSGKRVQSGSYLEKDVAAGGSLCRGIRHEAG